MKEHCPKLAIMLMQSASTSTQGCAFSDILAGGEDQRSFEQIVVSSADQGADLSPSVFSINVRDSVGNSIRTVVHHIPYRNIVGHVHHLVGLSEDTGSKCETASVRRRNLEGAGVLGDDDEEQGCALGRAAMPAAVLKEDVACGLGAHTDARLHQPGDVELDRQCSSSGGSSQDLMVEAWATEGLQISRVSEAFNSRFNGSASSCERHCFREWLSEEDGDRLARWVGEISHEVACGNAVPLVGKFGEAEICHSGIVEKWNIEVCFPKLHPELRRRQMYLVGIRLRAPTPGPDSAAQGSAAHVLSAAPFNAPGTAPALKASL